jgi:hypothetical protein
MPAPYSATSTAAARLPVARNRPAAPARTSAPDTTRFALWTQPKDPLASMLHACRVGSKPSLTAISIRDTTT